VLVLLALYNIARGISYDELAESLRAIPPKAILAALAATVGSYAVLLANDATALRYARAKPPVTAILLASFCGYALGNAVGLGSLSGSAIRYRVYSLVGLSAGQIARTTGFMAAAFAIGLSTTIALGLALRAGEVARLFSLPSTPLRDGAMAALTIASLTLCVRKRTPLCIGPMKIEWPSQGLVFVQLAIAITDIMVAATALWVLLPTMSIDFLGFVTVFAVALGLGILSHAPGGLGFFEATLLYAIGVKESSGAIIAALVSYRAVYFCLPLVLAAALLAGSEIRRAIVSKSACRRHREALGREGHASSCRQR
jgi:phosphatidylglycerol lysyltransferase